MLLLYYGSLQHSFYRKELSKKNFIKYYSTHSNKEIIGDKSFVLTRQRVRGKVLYKRKYLNMVTKEFTTKVNIRKTTLIKLH